MLTLGLCNIFGSFVSSMPTAGAFTRSAVVSASGVRTPMAGIYVGNILISRRSNMENCWKRKYARTLFISVHRRTNNSQNWSYNKSSPKLCPLSLLSRKQNLNAFSQERTWRHAYSTNFTAENKTDRSLFAFLLLRKIQSTIRFKCFKRNIYCIT